MAQYKLRIGSDCEFGFLNNKTKLQEHANKYILNRHGCNPNHVGLDGHNHIAEIRTGDGNISPVGHANDLRKVLANFQRTVPGNLIPVAGSMVGSDPIGGHMHFGVVKAGFGGTDFTAKMLKNLRNYGDVLDLFLAVPSLLVENNRAARRRRTSSYGKLSALRSTDYGFEYRTLPSWLVSFGFAQSFLSLAYVLVDHLVKGGGMAKFSDLGTGAAEKFYLGSRNYFYRLLPKLHKEVTKCPLYETYAIYISALFGFIKAFNQANPKKDWLEQTNFINRWYVEKYRCYWKLSYSPKDYRLTEILNQFSEHVYSLPVRIYGISAKTEKKFVRNDYRSPFIFYSKHTVPSGVNFGNLAIYRNMNSESRIPEKSGCLFIGLSYVARKQFPSLCKEFLRAALKPFVVNNPDSKVKLITIQSDNSKAEEMPEEIPDEIPNESPIELQSPIELLEDPIDLPNTEEGRILPPQLRERPIELPEYRRLRISERALQEMVLQEQEQTARTRRERERTNDRERWEGYTFPSLHNEGMTAPNTTTTNIITTGEDAIIED
jgi:hypothetical protein